MTPDYKVPSSIKGELEGAELIKDDAHGPDVRWPSIPGSFSQSWGFLGALA